MMIPQLSHLDPLCGEILPWVMIGFWLGWLAVLVVGGLVVGEGDQEGESDPGGGIDAGGPAKSDDGKEGFQKILNKGGM